MLTVAELIRYRMQHERYVHRVGEAMVPTRYGEFRMIAYESEVDGESHVALVMGDVATAPPKSPCWCACTRIAWSAMSLARTVRMPRHHRPFHADDRGGRPRRALYLHQTTKGFTVENVGDRSHSLFTTNVVSQPCPRAAPHAAPGRHRRADTF